LSGKTFGRLTAIKIHGKTRYGHYRWLCKCTCGNEKVVTQSNLGRCIFSCGCLQKERRLETHTKHGMTRTPTWNSWCSMLTRCYTPSNISFPYYGGKGVKVCERWRNSFANFLADMGERPKGKTIDRIHGGNYEPGNCRWSTQKEQVRNSSSAHYIEFRGERLTVGDWSERLGFSRQTLWRRIRKGWTLERVFTQPKQGESKSR